MHCIQDKTSCGRPSILSSRISFHRAYHNYTPVSFNSLQVVDVRWADDTVLVSSVSEAMLRMPVSHHQYLLNNNHHYFICDWSIIPGTHHAVSGTATCHLNICTCHAIISHSCTCTWRIVTCCTELHWFIRSDAIIIHFHLVWKQEIN